MRRRQWIMLVLATIIVSLLVRIDSQTFATQPDPPPGSSRNEQALNEAVQNLSSPDQLVRRNAGREIAKLSSVQGIQRAINPLIEAAADLNQADGIVNRSIYVGALGSICRQVGPPVNNGTVDFLAEVLLSDASDFMRVASARAIGLCKNESAIAPLEYAIDNDRAPFVVMQAEVSLDRLQRELGISGAATATMSFVQPSSDPLRDINSFSWKEVDDYIKTHFIIFKE